jgi:hypothetical protein
LSVTNFRGAPLLSLAFSMKDDAREAEAVMKAALAKVVAVIR